MNKTIYYVYDKEIAMIYLLKDMEQAVLGGSVHSDIYNLFHNQPVQKLDKAVHLCKCVMSILRYIQKK